MTTDRPSDPKGPNSIAGDGSHPTGSGGLSLGDTMIQYHAVRRVGDLVEEIVVTRECGRQTGESHVAFHADEKTAVRSMQAANDALFAKGEK